jgi:hypothetical protein
MDDPDDGNPVVIRENGRVGIGTVDPACPLDVDGEIRGALFRLMDDGGDNRLTFQSNDTHNTSEIVPYDENGTPVPARTIAFYADENAWSIQDGNSAYSVNQKIMTQLDCNNNYQPKDDGAFANNTIAMDATGNKHLRFRDASSEDQAVIFWRDTDSSLRFGFYDASGILDVDYVMFPDGALSAPEAVLTRAAGDNRYLQTGDASGFLTQGQADNRYLRRDAPNDDVTVTFGVISSSISGNTAQFRAWGGGEARIYTDGNLSARFFSDGDVVAQNNMRVSDETVPTANTLTPRSYVWGNTLCLDGITPQNVTASRNTQTWYVNNTGRPLLVHMDGNSISMQVRPPSGGIIVITNSSYTAMAVVPPTWQYRQSTASTVQNWIEYR